MPVDCRGSYPSDLALAGHVIGLESYITELSILLISPAPPFISKIILAVDILKLQNLQTKAFYHLKQAWNLYFPNI